MKKFFDVRIYLLAALVLSQGCANQQVSDQATAEVKKPAAATKTAPVVKKEVVREKTDSKIQELAQEQGDSTYSTLKFKHGQNQLDETARAELEKTINNAKSSGDIVEVQVVVWSDQEYPAKPSRLPRNQINLAKQRGIQIEKYIKEKLDVKKVSTHNMAQTPEFLSTYLSGSDARLKEKLVAEGIAPTTADAPAGHGRASTALIFVKTK